MVAQWPWTGRTKSTTCSDKPCWTMWGTFLQRQSEHGRISCRMSAAFPCQVHTQQPVRSPSLSTCTTGTSARLRHALPADQEVPPDAPVLILLPGLTGGSKDTYIRHMVGLARRHGRRALVFNSRC